MDPFSGEDESIRLDDWLPALQRAATWNNWPEEDHLLQLAGHLRGRALQEWELIPENLKGAIGTAVDALRDRLDPGGKVLAVQDFRHATQKADENVADFIRRLERCFRVAYGRDKLGKEAREALLHGQLQEGLKFELMRSPSVSGAQSYNALCLAAKNEEKRLAELKRRQRYKDSEATSSQVSQRKPNPRTPYTGDTKGRKPTPVSSGQGPRSCYTCGSFKHLQKDCKLSSTESRGRPQKPSHAKQVTVSCSDDPMSYLHSDSDEDEGVKRVTVEDTGSYPRYANVLVEGVVLRGVVDTGSDLTIMGKEAFKKVAAVAKLKKRDFHPSDKKAYSYDGRPFSLDASFI